MNIRRPFQHFFLVIMFLFLTINVQGLRQAHRRELAFNYFRNYDIIFIQETHWTDEIITNVERDWNGQILHNNGTERARGVAILIHERLNATTTNTQTDREGRILNTQLKTNDITLTLTNIYAPGTDTERRTFFRTIDYYISPNTSNVLGGDFNSITDKRDKRGGDLNSRQTATRILNEITIQHDLTDIWREQHTNARQFTWTGINTRQTNEYIQTRIDRLYISRNISQYCTNTQIKPYSYSDHDAVIAEMKFNELKRGPNYWHFNNTLLQNESFNNNIIQYWNDWTATLNEYEDKLKWWETAKRRFRVIAKQHATIQNKNHKRELDYKRKQTDRLRAKSQHGTRQDIQNYLEAQEQLRTLETISLEKTKTRTKAQFVEEGERSTKYFYNLERKRKADQTITELTTDDDTKVHTMYEIITETRQFYKTLYTKDQTNHETIEQFLDIPTNTLSADEREMCDADITITETTNAVKAMELNKSPGIDGLSSNFYKHFWDIIGPTLTQVYNYAYTRGELSLTQRRGVITLIYKKGDRTKLANWRPVSLLTTDYKILTKVLANRLTTVLPTLIHTDQTACVRGRTINDNVSLIRDAIIHANKTNKALAVISVDQLKAFDRVNHDFLIKTLTKFGFGPQYIRWIQTLYTNITSTVKVNGWFTAYIDLQRGLRQGCPLSAPLYILTAEILAIHIRNNNRILGFKTPNDDQVKLTQYADDTTLLLSDERSITETFTIFNNYERASGARLNRSKCKGLWSGSFKHRTDNIHGFDWFNDYIPDKILGFYFGNIDCTHRNIMPRINKLRNTCTAWKSRDLSLTGKTLIINSLLTSVLWYHAISLPVPPWAIQEIETIIYNFFWSNKAHAVNKHVLSLPKSSGGFNIHNINAKITALRLNTLRRLLEPTTAHWKSFVTHYLRTQNNNLGIHVLVTNFTNHQIDQTIPTYHRQLLQAWNKIRPQTTRTDRPTNINEILDEPLFDNPLITDTTGNTIHYRTWVKAGLERVKDICYAVVPGLLPRQAIIEQITDVNDTIRERTTLNKLDNLHAAIPNEWLRTINQQGYENCRPRATPAFNLQTNVQTQQPTNFIVATTRTLHQRIRDTTTPHITAIARWTQLRPTLQMNKSFWLPPHRDLITNKRQDYDWHIRHRTLPTAERLHRINVHNTPDCHNCNRTETIEHLLIDCPNVRPFWAYIQTITNRITNTNEQLEALDKLLGTRCRSTDLQDINKLKLINLILNTARFAIHKSAVMKRLYDTDRRPNDIFTADLKAQLNLQYNIYITKHKLDDFKSTWLINNALGTVENDTLRIDL